MTTTADFRYMTSLETIDREQRLILEAAVKLAESVKKPIQGLAGPRGQALTLQATGAARALIELKAQATMTHVKVVFIGNYNVGKSTVADVLVRGDVLPAFNGICTRVPFDVRYAERPAVECTLRDVKGHAAPPITRPVSHISQLKSVIEALSREHGDRVIRMTVHVPADVLRLGIVIVDTPGLDSIDLTGDKITRSEIETAEAAVIVVSEEQPTSARTRKLLESELPAMGHAAPFLVVNKVDRLDLEERARLEHDVHAAYRGLVPDDHIFYLSARAGLGSIAATGHLDPTAAPGWGAFEQALDARFADDAKHAVRIQTLARRGSGHLGQVGSTLGNVATAHREAVEAARHEVARADQDATRHERVSDSLRLMLDAVTKEHATRLRMRVKKDVLEIGEAAAARVREFVPTTPLSLFGGSFGKQGEQILKECCADVEGFLQARVLESCGRQFADAGSALSTDFVEKAVAFLKDAPADLLSGSGLLSEVRLDRVRAELTSAMLAPLTSSLTIALHIAVGAIFVKVTFFLGMFVAPLFLIVLAPIAVLLWESTKAKMTANLLEGAEQAVRTRVAEGADSVAELVATKLEEFGKTVSQHIAAPLTEAARQRRAEHAELARQAAACEQRAAEAIAEVESLTRQNTSLIDGFETIRAKAESLGGRRENGRHAGSTPPPSPSAA